MGRLQNISRTRNDIQHITNNTLEPKSDTKISLLLLSSTAWQPINRWYNHGLRGHLSSNQDPWTVPISQSYDVLQPCFLVLSAVHSMWRLFNSSSGYKKSANFRISWVLSAFDIELTVWWNLNVGIPGKCNWLRTVPAVMMHKILETRS